MDQIKEFLQDPTDYSIGVALLSKYSRNKTLVSTLARRENKAKLVYELSKLVNVVFKQVEKEKRVANKPINPKPKIDCKTLPDAVKPYYDRAAVAYQNARKNHYAMKSAKTDHERAKCRTSLLKHIADNHSAWDIVNKWQATGELPAVDQNLPRSLTSLATSLTRTLDKLDLTSDNSIRIELSEKCTLLIGELVTGGRVLSAKTMSRLKSHNIEV